MKTNFTIKAVEASKNVVLSAAKNESTNLLNILNFSVCCTAWNGMKGLTPKTVFSL